MASNPLLQVIHNLRSAVVRRNEAGLTDAQLLKCFVSSHDQAAFEALMGRHGPMVLEVCRRVLRSNDHDVEDAFQVTFLILVRKAASVWPRKKIANWLYGVAYNTALKTRAMSSKRSVKERQVTEMTERPAVPEDGAGELKQLLDQELSRLPEKYRLPVVLCELEGMTYKEAAQQMGISSGTVSVRLVRAKATLAKRLARHGVAVSVGSLAVTLSQCVASASVPSSLMASTIKAATLIAAGQAATSAISANAAALFEGVLKTMFLTKLRLASVVLLVSLTGMGMGLLAYGSLAGQPAKETQEKGATPAAKSRAEPDNQKASEPSAPFKNSPGWKWCQSPKLTDEFGLAFSEGNIFGTGFSAIIDNEQDKDLVVTLAFTKSRSLIAHRPVVFDAKRNRFEMKQDSGGGHGGAGPGMVMLVRYRLDPKTLPTSEVKYLGLEMLTPDGEKVRAKEALDRAKKSGTEVLAFPEIGTAYDFSLTTLDGKVIHGKNLRGKVVLIDCWATWCSPCMAKMPELKELYQKHHQDGLEIIGVSFDQDGEKAREIIKNKGLDWPHVIVPADAKVRDLWQEAAAIEGLPRLLLLDRSGVLRADCGPGELKELIGMLLQEAQNPELRK